MGSLRIIGGSWGGRRITAPDGQATRPLLDRIRQSLFDQLGQVLDGQVVADCFAGSGSFGFEALSRGAAVVHAVECAAPALANLRANAQTLGAGERFHLHQRPLPEAAADLPLCDVIFLDPPFPWYREQGALLEATIAATLSRLAPDGCLLIRGEKGEQLPAAYAPRIRRQQQWGRSWVAWL